MKRYSGNKVWWVVLFLSLAAVFGFIAGHSHRNATSTTDTNNPAVETADTPTTTTRSNAVNARKTPKAAPADLTSLDGKEFVDALPSLETLARGGNLDAARVLYQRLRSCVDFHASSDEEIRGRENADYQRQIEISRRIRSEYPDRPENPMFAEASLTRAHEKALKAAFDQRDLCIALTSQQIERYLDWAQFALERHDRQTILDATRPGNIGVKGVERVRNAERLMEIAEIERNDLNDLIATGDLSTLERAAYVYASDSNGLLRHDPELAYMYAYALSLAGGAGSDLRLTTAIMEGLANGRPPYPPLSGQQMDAARARGLALFQSCCARGARN